MEAVIAIVACHISQPLDFFAVWCLNSGAQVLLIISGYLYGKRSGIERQVVWFA